MYLHLEVISVIGGCCLLWPLSSFLMRYELVGMYLKYEAEARLCFFWGFRMLVNCESRLPGAS